MSSGDTEFLEDKKEFPPTWSEAGVTGSFDQGYSIWALESWKLTFLGKERKSNVKFPY